MLWPHYKEMDLADQYEATVAALKALSKELLIRNPAKLLQAARRRVPGASLRLPQLALEDSAARQTLASAPRSHGKSADEGPNERLQADLVDFSQNTKGTRQKYALMLMGVYTREVSSVPLPDKKPSTTNAVMQDVKKSLVHENKNYTISTDKGKEYKKIPAEAVHREKKASNDIAVLDRGMQTLKQDMAGVVADGDARNWVEALPKSGRAHNARPHSAVYGPPETVETNGTQDFRVLQMNAQKGLLNRNLQLNETNALRSAGAFRAPLPSKRSFEPRYGECNYWAGCGTMRCETKEVPAHFC